MSYAGGYKVRNYTLTLTTGTTLALSSVFGDTTVGGADDLSVQAIILQADPANSAVIKIGDSQLSATVFGFMLQTPVGALSVPPVILGPFADARVKPSMFSALGTTGDKLHFMLIAY